MNRNKFEKTAWVVVSLLLIRLLPYEKLENYSVFWISCLIAIPIYHYRINYHLFARRAIIATGCTQGGLAKKWLWRGTFLRIGNAVASIVIGYLILISATFLTNATWMIIISASILLISLEVATAGFADKQAVGRFLPIFHRESIKWPVYLFVIVACSTLYIFEPQDNLTQLNPIELTSDQLDASLENYEKSTDEYQSKFLGHSHALLSAFNDGTLYFAQNYIRRIEQTWAQWSLWVYLAIKSAAAIGLIVYLLLGILTVVTEKQRVGWVVFGKSLFEKSFTLTLILLFVLSIALGNISTRPSTVFPANSLDCSTTIEAYQRANLARTRELDEKEFQLRNEISLFVDKQLESVFYVSKLGVEKYLDWDFSVWGRYEQAFVMHVLRRADPTPEVLREKVEEPINTQLEQIQLIANTKILSEISKTSEYFRSQVANETQSSDCLEMPPFDIVFDHESIGLGQPQLAITTSALAIKVIATKAAAKAGVKGAAKVVAKGVSKLAGAGAGGLASGSVCGPAVLVCGPALAIVGWVGIDAAIIEAEEHFEREPLEIAIFSELEQQKEALRSRLAIFNNGLIATLYDSINPIFNLFRV